jgi:hypothetical protein
MPLDEHIAFCIEAMRGIAAELGLEPGAAATPALASEGPTA